MTSPPPDTPARHRADSPSSRFARRFGPALIAVTGVVVVILLLLLLNQRPSHPGPAPGAVAEAPAPTPTLSAVLPSSAAPSARPTPSTGPPSLPASEPPATQPPVVRPVAKPAVTVLNNSRISHLAARVAAEVAAHGWPIRQTGNFRGRIVETTVYYDPGQQRAAAALARTFSQIRRIEPRFVGLPGRGLTLVVTRDWSS